ncbi:hypothetical protein HHK36_018013 [Tetracentron sinense]|uniref:Germin-like protein n=1 Tax=Tetracentron sinense TaxID=13715 RepID=A0A834Z348_TETSI|nr:hypothetical protein HHK36_018013 [Tetracentron sinense]
MREPCNLHQLLPAPTGLHNKKPHRHFQPTYLYHFSFKLILHYKYIGVGGSPSSISPWRVTQTSSLLFLLDGSLEVGFVDTTNKLYTQTLQIGDMFVFPKGLVHFQYNADAKNMAFAVSAFGSANAGTVSVPGSVFTTGISDDILAKSFKTDVTTIEAIKAGLAPKA